MRSKPTYLDDISAVLPVSSTRSTIIVMVSTMISRLLGFVRIAVVGAIFGASGRADVLNLVFNIPNNLRKLLAEGALSSAFIPALSRSHVEDETGTVARSLVRRLIGFQLVVLVPIVAYSMIAPQSVVNVILDFPEIERQILAARLFRWFILYLILISIAAVLMGTLNSHGKFLVPALAPLWFSIAVISSVLFLHETLGVFSMVVGVLIGGLGQLLLQVPSVLRYRYTLIPSFRFDTPVFRKVLRQWVPVVSTASVFVINQQIALFFASGLSDGSGSALTNAIVFWQLPFGIFAASITTVLFPEMSRHFAQGDTKGLSRNVENGLRGMILLLVPSGVGLIALGEPIIAVALQRGAFSVDATYAAARVLRHYSIGLFAVGTFTFLQRGYYACDDYRTPLRVAVVTVVLDVLLSFWLKETRLGVAGLALANTIAFAIGTILFLAPVRRHARELSYRTVIVVAIPAVGASFAAVGVAYSLRAILVATDIAERYWWNRGSTFQTFLLLLVEVLPALLTIYIVYRSFDLRPSAIRRGRTLPADRGEA